MTIFFLIYLIVNYRIIGRDKCFNPKTLFSKYKCFYLKEKQYSTTITIYMDREQMKNRFLYINYKNKS